VSHGQGGGSPTAVISIFCTAFTGMGTLFFICYCSSSSRSSCSSSSSGNSSCSSSSISLEITCYLSGHPQSLVYIKSLKLLLAAFVLFELFSDIDDRGNKSPRSVYKFLWHKTS
jgi:hypothetical protein